MRQKTVGVLKIAAPVLIVLLLCGGWYLIWNRIGQARARSEQQAKYASFSFAGAIYEECTLEVLQLYDRNVTQLDAQCRGNQAGDADIADKTLPVYHFAPLEREGKRDGILLTEENGILRCYELCGFAALDDLSDMAEILDAYGMESAENIVSVRISDVNGDPVDVYTQQTQIQAFYEKLAALDSPLSAAELAKQYYDVYAAEYGENGKTDDLVLNGDTIQPKTEEIEAKAAAFWAQNIRIINLELNNGLWMNNLVYAPQLEMMTVCNNFRMTEPPFGNN